MACKETSSCLFPNYTLCFGQWEGRGGEKNELNNLVDFVLTILGLRNLLFSIQRISGKLAKTKSTWKMISKQINK